MTDLAHILQVIAEILFAILVVLGGGKGVKHLGSIQRTNEGNQDHLSRLMARFEHLESDVDHIKQKADLIAPLSHDVRTLTGRVQRLEGKVLESLRPPPPPNR